MLRLLTEEFAEHLRVIEAYLTKKHISGGVEREQAEQFDKAVRGSGQCKSSQRSIHLAYLLTDTSISFRCQRSASYTEPGHESSESSDSLHADHLARSSRADDQ